MIHNEYTQRILVSPQRHGRTLSSCNCASSTNGGIGYFWRGGCLLVLAAVTTMYIADTRFMPRAKRWLLLLLRVSAFVGLLVFFLDLQKRTEQKLVKNSRFSILVDTSQSMGIADMSTGDSGANEARVQQVIRAFGQSPLLESLQAKHDVTVYRFDETNQPLEVATFLQSGTDLADSESGVIGNTLQERITEAKP